MNYPKLTNSIDDIKRFTVKVEFRASRHDLINAFASLLYEDFNLEFYKYTNDEVEDILNDKKVLDEVRRIDIWKKLKELLYYRGNAFWMRLEGEECEDGVRLFCTNHIDRFFPEFKES
jgi:hypothetical protein